MISIFGNEISTLESQLAEIVSKLDRLRQAESTVSVAVDQLVSQATATVGKVTDDAVQKLEAAIRSLFIPPNDGGGGGSGGIPTAPPTSPTPEESSPEESKLQEFGFTPSAYSVKEEEKERNPVAIYKDWKIYFEIPNGGITECVICNGKSVYWFPVGDTDEDYEFHFDYLDDKKVLAHAKKAIDSLSPVEQVTDSGYVLRRIPEGYQFVEGNIYTVNPDLNCLFRIEEVKPEQRGIGLTIKNITENYNYAATCYWQHEKFPRGIHTEASRCFLVVGLPIDWYTPYSPIETLDAKDFNLQSSLALPGVSDTVNTDDDLEVPELDPVVENEELILQNLPADFYTSTKTIAAEAGLSEFDTEEALLALEHAAVAEKLTSADSTYLWRRLGSTPNGQANGQDDFEESEGESAGEKPESSAASAAAEYAELVKLSDLVAYYRKHNGEIICGYLGAGSKAIAENWNHALILWHFQTEVRRAKRLKSKQVVWEIKIFGIGISRLKAFASSHIDALLGPKNDSKPKMVADDIDSDKAQSEQPITRASAADERQPKLNTIDNLELGDLILKDGKQYTLIDIRQYVTDLKKWSVSGEGEVLDVDAHWFEGTEKMLNIDDAAPNNPGNKNIDFEILQSKVGYEPETETAYFGFKTKAKMRAFETWITLTKLTKQITRSIDNSHPDCWDWKYELVAAMERNIAEKLSTFDLDSPMKKQWPGAPPKYEPYQPIKYKDPYDSKYQVRLNTNTVWHGDDLSIAEAEFLKACENPRATYCTLISNSPLKYLGNWRTGETLPELKLEEEAA